MISKELIENTIIDLLDIKSLPNVHKRALSNIKPNDLSDLIKELNSTFEQEMISYALQEKDIHVPHIGFIKIKRGTKLVRQIKQELLTELGVELIEDLTPSEREDFEMRVNAIKIDIIKRNALELKRKRESEDNFDSELLFDIKPLTDTK